MTATGEPDTLATRTGEWLLNHVWTAFTLDVQPLDRANQVSWEPGAEIAEFEVHPTADPGILYVAANLGLNIEPDELHLDLYTGAEVGSDLPPEPSATGQPPIALAGWVSKDGAAGWDEGPAGVAASWSLEHLGRSGTHLFVFRDGGWRWVSERAGDPDQVVFTADDQVWVGWREGRVLSWSPLGAR